MKIFIDTAKIEEIEQAYSYGILDGVTTNPSLMKKIAGNGNLTSYIKKILKTAKGTPVSLEVVSSTYEEMLKEGKNLYKKFNPVANNVVIKVPINPGNVFDGIKTIKALTKAKIPTNCTLVFTPEQALLAAKAGATFVSPFVGRIDDFIRKNNGVKFEKSDYFPAEGLEKKGNVLEDNGIVSGVDLVNQIALLYDVHGLPTQILAASIRNARQVREVALAGADIATLPFNVINEMMEHPKTTEGMKNFVKDTVKEYADIVKK